MPVNYDERISSALAKPRLFSQLNEMNQAAANDFMEKLLELQNKKQDGKILTHVDGGIAHKHDVTFSSTVRRSI